MSKRYWFWYLGMSLLSYSTVPYVEMMRQGRWPDNGTFALMHITWMAITIVVAVHFTVVRRTMTRAALLVPALLGLGSCYFIYVTEVILVLLTRWT